MHYRSKANAPGIRLAQIAPERPKPANDAKAPTPPATLSPELDAWLAAQKRGPS